MWLRENEAIQNRCRHDDACFSAKTSTPLPKHELKKNPKLPNWNTGKL